MFSPERQYQVIDSPTTIRDFHDYAEDYVVRPPYQRKSVWSRKKQQDLMDSLLRRYYVPRIVIREIRLGPQQVKKEVIDGQQRIDTVQSFFAGDLPLPNTLKDVSPELAGASYAELGVPFRKFVDKELRFDVDLVTGIDDPNNAQHQTVAAQIFWRLQQGEDLTYMEKAHSRLSSLARNFVVKYADDISFDYEAYEPRDHNAHKHAFFSLLSQSNDRMQHLALLTRLLMLEAADGPADVRDTNVGDFIDDHQQDDGIGDLSMEQESGPQAVLQCLSDFRKAFDGDPMIADGSPLRELSREYFIISFFLLLRHLRKYYAVGAEHLAAFRSFLIWFHQRWNDTNNTDPEVLLFRDSRQQGKREIETRHRVLRELFFRHLLENETTIRVKDQQRTFNEAQRIFIYRRDQGLCQACRAEGKSPEEARVPWSDYEADHVLPHSKGGLTEVENAQVLCSYHNQLKGATEAVPSVD